MLKIIEVSQSNLEDLNEVFTLYQEFYNMSIERNNKESNIEFFEELLSNDKSAKQFLAYIWDDVIWFVTIYYSFSSLSRQRIWIFNDLYIKEAFRWNWHWKELIAYTANYLKEKWINKMVWETAPDNHKAQKLYDSIGGAWELWKVYELML